MDRLPIIGNYERELNYRSFNLPNHWKDPIRKLGTFYFFQPTKCPFMSVISEGHFQRYVNNIREKLPSPIDCNEGNLDEFLATVTADYGPVKIDMNGRGPYINLTIPYESPFIQNKPKSSKVSLVGMDDYFVILYGEFVDHIK